MKPETQSCRPFPCGIKYLGFDIYVDGSQRAADGFRDMIMSWMQWKKAEALGEVAIHMCKPGRGQGIDLAAPKENLIAKFAAMIYRWDRELRDLRRRLICSHDLPEE